MIERERESETNYEKDRQHQTIVEGSEDDATQVDHQNESFSGDDISHDRADKETFLTFKNYTAEIATMFEVERPLNN